MDDGTLNGHTVLTAYLPLQKGSPFTSEEVEEFFGQVRSYFPDSDYKLITLEYIPAKDWLASWKKTFVPFHVTEKIVVRPTWESYQVQPGEIEIVIDPKMAFGTGYHETTAQCLRGIEKLGVENKSVLDYGCGAGILAIAAVKMGASKVIACDIDPEAVKCTRENFALNNVDIEPVESGSFIAEYPCDLIAANLSIDQIIATFDNLDKSLKPNGCIIFSGIPYDNRQRFLDFIAVMSYNIIDEIAGDEWISYIGMKKNVE